LKAPSCLLTGLIESDRAGEAAIGRHRSGPAFGKHEIKGGRLLVNERVAPAALLRALLDPGMEPGMPRVQSK